MIFEEKQKSQPIEKRQVWDAFKAVKKNGGSAGVDGLNIPDIESDPRKYLYPIWNRLASGSYYPMPVREVLIPKDDGSKRALGIPTVVDRVAQMVIRKELESIVNKQFSKNSYGYRPKTGAHAAVQQCSENCMRYNWAIDLDIKGFFDNIDHELMMRAVKHFTSKGHILLYVERWLKCPVQKQDGTIQQRTKGTPQGGVISPVLANIFLHFAFDRWFERKYPECRFERYADDIIIHCNNFKEAFRVLDSVTQRMNQCKLELKRGKNNIVYCKRKNPRSIRFKPKYSSFDFLGFTFKPRMVKTKRGIWLLAFAPGISRKSQRKIGQTLFKMKIHRMVHLQLSDIAQLLADKLRGWIYYYGRFRMSELKHVLRILNMRLAHWVRNKYRRFWRKHRFFAFKWLQEVSRKYPAMFVHWRAGFMP